MFGDATNESSVSSALKSFTPDNVVWLPFFFANDPNVTPHVRYSWLMHAMVRMLPIMSVLDGARLVYVSSDMVYKPKTGLIKETSIINWESPNMFITDKLIAEKYVTSVCKNLKIPLVILRPSIIVGKRDFLHPMADPLTFIIQTLLSDQPLLVKHGQQKRDYILVRQACVMIANLLGIKDFRGVYNVSSASGMPNAELIQKLIPIIRPQVLPKVMESKEGHFLLDNTKIMACGEAELTDILSELPDIVEHRKALLEAP
jgi:nucleoside-diphosphate-sugar epimerase